MKVKHMTKCHYETGETAVRLFRIKCACFGELEYFYILILNSECGQFDPVYGPTDAQI